MFPTITLAVPGPRVNRRLTRTRQSGAGCVTAFRAYPKTASEKGTVPFCSEDSAKLGQSPAVFG